MEAYSTFEKLCQLSYVGVDVNIVGFNGEKLRIAR